MNSKADKSSLIIKEWPAIENRMNWFGLNSKRVAVVAFMEGEENK